MVNAIKTETINLHPNCPIPCNTINVQLLGNNVFPQANNFSKTVLFFPRKINHNLEHYVLDLTGLLASIGGYVGLFMGYSMLQLAMVVLEQFEMIGKRKKEDKEA